MVKTNKYILLVLMLAFITGCKIASDDTLNADIKVLQVQDRSDEFKITYANKNLTRFDRFDYNNILLGTNYDKVKLDKRFFYGIDSGVGFLAVNNNVLKYII